MTEPDSNDRSKQPGPPSTPAATAPAVVGSTGGHLLRGSIWMIAVRWAMRLIGLVSTMILARLLAPDDFGLIAMVMLTYGLLETISYAGVDLALMRSGADSRAHYDTAWTVQILQGIFIATCLVIAAPYVASYFNEPRVQEVMYWVVLRPLIDSLQNIGTVAFRKELDFAKEFRFTIYVKALNFFVVIGMALWLRSYWALVYGSIIASIVGVAVSYAMHPYRPRLSLAKIKEIWGFSQWLMISRIGSYLNRKCDEMVVGGYAGTTAMGNYHVANELATLPSSEIVMPIRRAMFPTLTKIADRKEEFTAAVLSGFSSVSALCLFVSFSLLVTAPEVVSVVLGSKWSEAAPLMKWMALFGGFSALVLVLEVPLWVAGKTNISAAQTWLELAIILPATLLAVQSYGAEGAAAARAGVSMLMVPIMMALTARYGSVSFVQLAGALARPLAAAVIMAAVVHSLPLDSVGPALLRLAAKGAVCTVLYPLLLLLLWRLSGRPPGVEATVVKLVRDKLSSRRTV
ncbi:MAG: lipopolysaccharide biosynthesis protein [Rubrivivax sp.]|nr:lipopolysaccharide biosynthesis protein [Rubrivivax sp.]